MALQGVLFVCFSLPHPLIFFWGTDLFSQARIPLGGAFSDERAYCSTILPTSFTLKLAPRCGSRCRSPGPPPKPLRTRPREAPEKSRGGARPPAASAAPQASSPPSPPPGSGAGGAHAGRARAPALPAPLTRRTPRAPLPSGRGGAASARTGVPCVPGCRHSRTLDPRRPTPRPPQLDSCGPHPSTWDGCGVRGAGCGASLPRPSGGLPPSGSGRATRTLPSILERSVSYSDDGWAMDGCQGRLPKVQQKRTRPAQWNHSAGMSRRPSAAGGGAGPPTRGTCSGWVHMRVAARAATCSSCPAAACVAAGRGAARALCSGVWQRSARLG